MTRLVVIDTLAKIRPHAHGSNVYKDDYQALEKLLPLADEHGVAIVVVHHLRKGVATDAQDEISGSTGLSGGVDGFMILRRKPGSRGPTLFVDGRDIEEPEEYALHWNPNTATWTIEGAAEEVHLSKERGDVLLTLNRSPEPMTPKEVSDLLPSATHGSVKKLMWTMLGDGQLTKDGKGRYSSANPTGPPDPGNSGNPGNRANDSGSVTTGLPQRPASGNPGDGHRYGENGGSVTPVTGVSGIRQDREDKGAELCKHGLPGGKGCYLCDPDHPFRLKDGPAHAGVGAGIEEEEF